MVIYRAIWFYTCSFTQGGMCGYIQGDMCVIHRVPGANFTNRLKLSLISLCIRFKSKNRLKSVREIGP